MDRLIEDKEEQLATTRTIMYSDVIREREELSEQIRALKMLKELAKIYGCDISKPANNVLEATQAVYFSYLAAVKEQNGAAMSLGRTSTFLDIYAERDLKEGTFTEKEIQEIIDQFVMKLRCVKFARTPEYNSIFAGDPTWVTESIGGIGVDGRHMVTKMSYRYLNTLNNIGAAPEPNMTVLWSVQLPENFKRFCAQTSIRHSAIQYENDDIMRVVHGDDYGIACCVSSMRIGKEMQFFGARANLAKCLLYAINGGVDEISGKQVGPKYRPITSEYLDYDEVWDKYKDMMKWLAGVYVNALNIIHYMHDKYCYEKLEMALHDKKVRRWFATGIAGSASHIHRLCQGQPHLPRRNPDDIDPHDHIQRILRQEHRCDTGWQKEGCCLCTGRKPDARTRHERCGSISRVGSENAVYGFPGWYLQHVYHRAGCTRQG